MNPIRVTASHFGETCSAICVLALLAAVASARAQSPGMASAVEHGHVRDSKGRALANATVLLQLAAEAQTQTPPPQITHTDSEGAYRFAALREGAYTLRAEMKGYAEATSGPVNLERDATKEIDFTLVLIPIAAKTTAPEFFDEPQFTVAGVTQATNSGGHGSDTVLRTTEALARATVSLSKESNAPAPASSESALRDSVTRSPNDPALHHQLGELEETLGNPLEAVREYQRAAELDPSEPNLFDWGAELLTHRALEPATEVFANGNRRFPKSVRMLVALGVSWFARGSYDRAEQYLVAASDLAPDDPTPYVFLGRMLGMETAPSEESAKRLARFAQLQPGNALANYYYAVSLSKRSPGAADDDAESSARVESLLLKAVHLDPKLGAAYLQLGTLYSRQADFARAISAYENAIAASPAEVSVEFDEMLAEAHYRLAQAYLRTGDKAKAQAELQLHDDFAKKTNDDTDRERREIQQFVIPLRNNSSASQ
jgi:tetratricopeptide (TPR) repeat protein